MRMFFMLLSSAILGAAFGSFACCQAWRIKKNDKSKYSHCMNCKYQLRWYDNVPIVSWLVLGGKCRKCHKEIGFAELFAEIGLAATFALSFWLWPMRDSLVQLDAIEWVKFGLFLACLAVLAILFIYDARWEELPVSALIIALIIALVFWGVKLWQSYSLNGFYDWGSFALALLLFPGLYYLIYKVSKESWVGGGDWILCLPLALMLGNVWLSIWCVFLSNMIGSAAMLPFLIKEKKKRKLIPFGPFLIIGFLVVFFAQGWILGLMRL